MWRRSSIPVYAVCDPIGKLGTKQKRILNVGRFTSFNPEIHHKRQDILIDTFVKMEELHQGGWELHLAGSFYETDSGTYADVESLIKTASGVPVFFHFNVVHSDLVELYRSATIYWHATGFGSVSVDSPGTQEHFGITTVEAMFAGCVLVVINSGGQLETVTDGESGYLWNTVEELSKRTLTLTQNSQNYEEMSAKAELASHQFTREIFNSRIDHLLNTMN